MKWSRTHSYEHAAFGECAWPERDVTVSVCVPAREEAATIAAIVSELIALRDREVIDEVVVLDGASRDGTAALAEQAGAIVCQQAALRPELGPVLGKGDAMWRALSVLGGDIVCYLDADTETFGAHFVTGLIGPLLADENLHFVKGCYRRPFKAGGIELPDGGGRVNELTARPLLNRFFPELAAIRQPLAGEVAARRGLLESLPFFTGYGVEIGLLIDAYRAVGLDGIAEVDLGARQNRHQALSELGPMASSVLGAVTRRLEDEGRLSDTRQESFLAVGAAGYEPRELALVERPPMGPDTRGGGLRPGAGRLAPAGSR